MAQDPKEILIQHGEKIALGVVALAAGIVVLTSSTGDAQKLSERIRGYSTTIASLGQRGIGADSPKMPKAADPLPALLKPIGPMVVSMPDDLPWTYYRKPPVEVTSTPGPAPIVAPNIKLDCIRASASREKIEVNWDRPPSRGMDPIDKVERSACSQLGYILVKVRKGQEDKPKVTYLDSGTGSINDNEFEPETTYSYKVRVYWEFKREGKPFETPEIRACDKVTEHVLEDGPHKGKTVWITDWSTPVSVTTALNIGLAYSSRSGDKATIVVWQFWRGNWWRVAFPVEIGESIGRQVSASDLVEDKYNKERHSSTKDYQDMLALQKSDPEAFKSADPKSSDPKKRGVPWKSGYVYFGYAKEPKAEAEHVVLEHHEVPMRGANGLDWGTRMTKVMKSKGDTPPDQAPPGPGEGSGSGS